MKETTDNNETKEPLQVYVLSDGTGETAEQMLKAALVHFKRGNLRIIRKKNIRTQEQVDHIVKIVAENRAMIVYTLVTDQLQAYLKKEALSAHVTAIDLLGPLMESLSRYLDKDPYSRPGLFHQVNEYYYRRIEAIEFAVKHDDGRYADSLAKADIVLVGLSRTSKTPLSVYLSYKGWKVANVPVVKDISLPPELFQMRPEQVVVGLTIDAEALVRIRRERLIRMGENVKADYASLRYVLEEINYCNSIFAQNKQWPVFNVTNKALEETASEVERVVLSQRRLLQIK